MTKQEVQREIEKVITRDEEGRFQQVDLSLEGVNEWRKSVGLEPLDKLP